MPQVVAVILAAGKGVRMCSALPKVAHTVAGKPLISHVVSAARQAGIDRVVVVVGHGRELLADMLKNDDVALVVQEEQLGTGHALLQAEAAACDASTILVLCGDTPLLRGDTLLSLLRAHEREKASATVLTANLADPAGYGRVVRDRDGSLARIVEEKDASHREKNINEINTGIYCFNPGVFALLRDLKPDNAQGEYYLTDALAMLKDRGEKVAALPAAGEQEVLGVNDRMQLAVAEKLLRRRECVELMLAGVTIIDPDVTYIDDRVEVGMDTIIYPLTFLEGNTTIGPGCTIGPGVRIIDSRLAARVVIENAKVIESQIGPGCTIGPYSYLRPETILTENVKVGDFVEVKKSRIGPGSKLPHLSYVGDAEVGSGVNIGAGTITCNYDGHSKHPTVIGDGAFIGSNTNLVAPVKIGSEAITGAGSTITRDVPDKALAVERAPQKHIDDWNDKKRTGKSD